MVVVSTLNVPHEGTGRVVSIEDSIWDGETTSVIATVGRMLGASRGTRGGGLRVDVVAVQLIENRNKCDRAPSAPQEKNLECRAGPLRAGTEGKLALDCLSTPARPPSILDTMPAYPLLRCHDAGVLAGAG